MSRSVDGLQSWLLQRISAVYLAGFLVYLFLHFLLQPIPDYEAWRGWIGQPLTGVLFSGFVLALLVHGWVGLRDVVLDYIHPLGVRLPVLTLIAFLLAGCGLWAIRVLLLAGG